MDPQLSKMLQECAVLTNKLLELLEQDRPFAAACSG